MEKFILSGRLMLTIIHELVVSILKSDPAEKRKSFLVSFAVSQEDAQTPESADKERPEGGWA